MLDTFLFDDLRGGLERNPGETERLLEVIEGAVLGKVDVAALIGKRRSTRSCAACWADSLPARGYVTRRRSRGNLLPYRMLRL